VDSKILKRKARHLARDPALEQIQYNPLVVTLTSHTTDPTCKHLYMAKNKLIRVTNNVPEPATNTPSHNCSPTRGDNDSDCAITAVEKVEGIVVHHFLATFLSLPQ
jgi:hypothetical protein